jgi:hypothetical protein
MNPLSEYHDSSSIMVYMQGQDRQSENSSDDLRNAVKNTCVGTDELELLMLEDQQNIDSLSSHVSTKSIPATGGYQQFEVVQSIGSNRYVVVEKN